MNSYYFFFSSRRRHTRYIGDWSSDVCSSDLDLGSVRKLAARIRQAGIASAASAALHNVEAPSASDVADLLRTMIAALEASPVPEFEWAGVGRVLDPERLASLLSVSISSLNRYQSGEREIPDAVAARLHFLAP